MNDKDKSRKNLSFEEKELEILRKSVDKAEAKLGKKIKQTNDITSIIKILETFLRRKKVVCYGGTAINNILPVNDQFYNKDIEIPDYDFYSPSSITHATELADIYAKNGYTDTEVRSGMHKETYKVFVNFIPIADITQLEPKIFKVLFKNSIRKDGISYAPPDYIRMQTYNELSRPDGDVTRWEKIYKRLILLNRHYPFNENPKCSQVNFMRDFTGNPELNETLYTLVKDTMINEGVVFIGGYASSLYGRYMPPDQKKQLLHVPDFDVLAEDPKANAYILKEKLENEGFKNVKVNKKPEVGNEIIMAHYEIVVDEDHVQGNARVLHPKRLHAHVLKDKQHARIVLEVLAEHEPLAALACCEGELNGVALWAGWRVNEDGALRRVDVVRWRGFVRLRGPAGGLGRRCAGRQAGRYADR